MDNNETPHRFLPGDGDFIDGYKVLAVLGEGAFGIVYKVQDAAGEVRALKLIKLWEVAYEKERMAIRARFEREFLISTMESKYLVKSFSHGAVLGNPYFTMEFCSGGSLERWCGRFASNPDAEAIVYQILHGLKVLHTRGYIHRDIKPANILLVSESKVNIFLTADRAKLADFGIAGSNTSRLTVTNFFGKPNQIFGTWPYLSPEAESNAGGSKFKSLNVLSDIFSFGVTMFELFTGEYPFPPYKIENDSDLITYRQGVKKGDYDNLRRSGGRIPAKWLPILAKCMDPDFEKKRFRNADEVLTSLGYTTSYTPNRKPSDCSGSLGLQITYGEELNKIYALDQLLSGGKSSILTIGRKDEETANNIEITENTTTYISRKHATLERWNSQNCWRIRDGQFTADGWRKSVNGVYLNSKEVGAGGCNLQEGDIVTLGDTTLKVVEL